jgi:hypothetical protein
MDHQYYLSPDKAIKVINNMSSTIIPGISEELGLEYLQSYNDEGLRFKFSGIATTCDVSFREVRQFRSCLEAVTLLQELHFSQYKCPDDIYLNRSNGTTIRLEPAEVEAIVRFEQDEEMFEMFQMYAEKMSRPGRQLAASQQEAMEEEEDEYNPDDWDGDAEADDFAEIVMRHNRAVMWEEDPYLKLESENQELRILFADANHRCVNLQMQVERAQRDMAMEWIMSMDNMQFDQRLITNSPNYKLPDFERAQPGDEDHPDLSRPQRDIAVPLSRHPLTYEQVEGGFSNFACLKRSMLRYMSIAEFKALAYEEPWYYGEEMA